MLTDMFMNMSSPSGTDPENGNASMCRVVGFYFLGSWAPPGPHEAFPCTLRTCPATLSAGGREKKDKEIRIRWKKIWEKITKQKKKRLQHAHEACFQYEIILLKHHITLRKLNMLIGFFYYVLFIIDFRKCIYYRVYFSYYTVTWVTNFVPSFFNMSNDNKLLWIWNRIWSKAGSLGNVFIRRSYHCRKW